MNNLCKKVIASVLALTMIASGIIFAQRESADVKAADEWNLVWSDEFNGTSLDTGIWNYEIGNGDWGWGNGEKQYYTNSTKNVEVSDGSLKIHALKDDAGHKYTSGRITTKNKKTFKFGRIEAKMKLPSFSRSWPAFWMLGTNGGWPKCGEIDIMEAINTEKFTHGHLHWYTEGASYTGHADSGKSSEGVVPADFDRTQWHTYGVEWDKKSLKWYVDGTVFYTMNISSSDFDEVRNHYYIIFNLAIGGQWPGLDDEGIDNSAFPSRSTMEVDYVRVYQKTEAPTTKYDGPTITVTEDAVSEYKGTWNKFFGGENGWIPATGTLETADTPGNGFTANITSVGNIANDSVWAAQATLEKLKYYPGNTYKYSCVITSDKDKKIFVKVADSNEETLGGGLIDLKAGVPYNFETNVDIPEDYEGTVSLKFGMGKTNGDTVADNSAVTINVKDISFVTTATIPDPSYVPETTTKNPNAGSTVDNQNTTVANNQTTKSQAVKGTTTSSDKVAGTKVKEATKKNTSKKVKLTLKRIEGATGYKVQFSKTKKFKKILVTKIFKKAKFTVMNKKLKNTKKLYVRVKAYKKVGNKKYYSKKWSKVKKVKIKK